MKRRRSNQERRSGSEHFSLRKTTAAFLAVAVIILSFAGNGLAATGTVNYNTVYQQIEGFGGAAVYDCPKLIAHTKKEEIYDLLFKDLGIEILRIRNTYGYTDFGENLNATADIVAEAKEPGRTPNIKTELVPWSPAKYLKSNNDVNNGGTLAGGPSDYIYDDYAQWWYESLLAWEANGVEVNFISLQNEPDIATSYDSCRFDPTENSANAGYDQAFEAVWQKLNTEMGSSMPKMWAPCTMGFGNSIPYIDALIDVNHADGFSHHLYTDGSYDSPDGMTAGMSSYYSSYGYKPLHMTEYVRLNTTPNFDMAWRFAWHVYNCLYYEHVTSYFNWTLFRGYSTTSGGIVTMTTIDDYIIRPQYWYLMAYSRFTDRDWSVVNTSVSGTTGLRMSAFKDPGNSKLTVVILNLTAGSVSLTGLTLNDFSPDSSEVYQSSENNYWVSLGEFSGSLTLPTHSITTIAFESAVTLNCSSTTGGSVTTPGEGDFQYAPDTNAAIVATADADCHFINWTGTAVDAGKVADANSASTTVTMDADYTVIANFEPNRVEIIGSWMAGTSHAQASGASRALLLMAHAEEAGAISLNSVTYGGQPMTKIIDVNVGTSARVYVAGYMLDEAGIAAATDSNFIFTWSTTPDSAAYGSVFLQNVNQTDSIGASARNGTTSSQIISTAPLATSNGDMVIDAATNSQTGGYTVLNGFTEALELTISSADAVEGYKLATGVNETPSVSHNNYLRQVLIGFVVQAVEVILDCGDVQDANYGLMSDLTGDCYVDYQDLEVIATNWLADCTEPDNCEGADLEPADGIVDLFDYSDFAMQWLWCNNPEDANCPRNW